MMPDRETVITHLQIIHTWAAFACERDLQFFTAKHLEDIAKWSDDAIELLKEQEAAEPKQGGWIYCEDASGQDGYKCSECGFFEPWYYDFENHNFITDYAYCPSCGKPMQEGR